MIPLPATVIGNGEDLEGFAGAGLFESVCAEEAGNLSWELCFCNLVIKFIAKEADSDYRNS